MPLWLLLALAAAVLTAAREALFKAAAADLHPHGVAVAVHGTGALLLLPLLLLREGLLRPEPSFWWALAVSGGINAVAAVMIVRAVYVSDLSLVSPLKALTPVFMLLTGPLILRELPGPIGAAGVLAVGCGGWLLARTGPGLLEPFRALARDRGVRLMTGVAALFAVSATVDKVGVLASSPLTWAVALKATVALLVLPLAIRRGGLGGGRPLTLLAGGAASAASVAAQMTALPLTFAAYVIAAKRSSILFAVLFGAIFFGERATLRRLAGAAIMLTGLVLLTLR